MTTSQHIPEALLALMHQACNGTILNEDLPKLEEGLKENLHTRALFADMLRQEARLTLKHQTEEALRPTTEMLDWQTQRGQAWHKRLLPAARHAACSAWPYAAAAMLLIGLFLPGTLRIAEPARGLHARNHVAASMAETYQASWQNGDTHVTPASRGLQVGEMVRLREGLVELDYHEGSRVVIEGPAVFQVASLSSGRLHAGRVVTTAAYDSPEVLLETKNAIVTGRSAIVGMDVDRSGDAKLVVFDGVASIKISDLKLTIPEFRLRKGEAIELTDEGFRTMDASFLRDQFKQRIPKPVGVRPFQGDSIWLGNLFDDGTSVDLTEAMRTDTFAAAAETLDLGVATVIDGGLDVDVRLATEGATFNFWNVGGFGVAAIGLPANDTYRSVGDLPIRTTGVQYDHEAMRGVKVEEGVGMHANELLTFDLDEIRSAGQLGSRRMRFVAERAGINDDIDFKEVGLPSSVRLAAIVSTESEVLAGYINGKRVSVAENSGVYSFSAASADSDRDCRFLCYGYASFDVPIPLHARYLTLVALSGNQDGEEASGDHAVFSGARLQIEPESRRPDLAANLPFSGVASLVRVESRGLLSLNVQNN